MNKKILLIDHHDNPRDDRATVYLKEMGFEIDLRLPVNGDPLPEIDDSIRGAVIYGGEHNVTEIDRFPFLQTEIQWIKRAIDTGLPLVGICLGAQLIAHSLGARVDYHPAGLCEFGYYKIKPTDNAQDWICEDMFVTQAHYQQLSLPEGAILLATADEFPNQAFRYNNNVFGLQFHPEVSSTIFRRWQNSDWAFFDQPGSQTREQQDKLIDSADRIQGQWFHNFLEKVFGLPLSTLSR